MQLAPVGLLELLDTGVSAVGFRGRSEGSPELLFKGNVGRERREVWRQGEVQLSPEMMVVNAPNANARPVATVIDALLVSNETLHVDSISPVKVVPPDRAGFIRDEPRMNKELVWITVPSR